MRGQHHSMWFSLLLISFFVAAGVRAADPRPWPGVDYVYVKGYLYGGELYTPRAIILDGNINPLVEKVVRLTAPQVKEISAAIQNPPKGYDVAACFEPHHAFVYFDKFSRPVAW